ncbi:hypothetical protein OVY29_03745 [Sphingopyxis sp. SE2]|uniref:hypothetical protein n=1 Tax=Sphingopyxis sp. SE2 TaxID=1586240 RepID=UPI0028C072A4|nr:hypothetical protein [Sphingopyxis sp. SE2]MDT7527775.1 hypothetical protein [Sphingopyxis sp. SE2]
MPMLGDLLAAARDGAGRFDGWLQAADPERAEGVHRAALAEGMSPTAFIRMAVADFSRLAEEEDWATLTSAMRDSEDPGTMCLLAMVDWRLSAPTCSDHRVSARERTSHEPAAERTAS